MPAIVLHMDNIMRKLNVPVLVLHVIYNS